VRAVSVRAPPIHGQAADHTVDPRLRAAIVDRLTFGGNIAETGTDCYRLASTGARAADTGAATS
jgi:hypothetical protein